MSNYPYISGLDHVVINVPDLEAAVRDSEKLFRKEATGRGKYEGGDACLFQFANTGLLLREAEGEFGLAEVCFEVPRADRFLRRLKAIDLGSNIQNRADPYETLSSAGTNSDVYELSSKDCRSLHFSFVERSSDWASQKGEKSGHGLVKAMDHLVIRTQNTDAIMALLGARLGLNLRLDINRPEWGAQLLFFRCGDMVLEVARQLKDDSLGAEEDYFWGISWRVEDAARAVESLRAQGVDVSEARKGRRPGTEVFTVRDHNCDVPTIMLQTPKR
ncbi:VOC family protein [Sneathiella limimaris]|uniref:VOC family protein n=1 Tax=Sneathiella limimaris TaxID=1964213 RepID=UPI00146CA241|nr:VOC family protein [Sneathiella limimaris]